MATVRIDLYALLVIGTIGFSSSNDDTMRLAGEEKLAELTRLAQLPDVGNCWRDALAELGSRCALLDESTHSRMALRFASCYMQQLDYGAIDCSPDKTIRECIHAYHAAYNQRLLPIHTEFFTHTRNLCHHLAHRVWQKDTQATIRALSTSSEELAYRLNDSLETSKAIVQHGLALNETLTTSVAVQQQFQREFERQRQLSAEMANQLMKLRSVFIDEFSSIASLVLYFVSTVAAYLLTSSERVSAARFWIFSIVLCMVIRIRRYY